MPEILPRNVLSGDALGPAGTADVPLVPVDHVLLALSGDGRADVRGIAAGHPWLGHRVSAPQTKAPITIPL